MGQVLREGGNVKDAIKIHKMLLYRKKIENYEKIELYKNLALDYYDSKDYDLALNELESILKIEKNNEWALSTLVKVYREQKNWNRAGHFLEKYQKLTKKK